MARTKAYARHRNMLTKKVKKKVNNPIPNKVKK